MLAYADDRPQARREFERALELNPHDVQGRCWYALFYLQWVAGEFEQGVSHARRALADDPLSAYTTMIVAACLGTAGRLDEAGEMGRLADLSRLGAKAREHRGVPSERAPERQDTDLGGHLGASP